MFYLNVRTFTIDGKEYECFTKHDAVAILAEGTGQGRGTFATVSQFRIGPYFHDADGNTKIFEEIPAGNIDAGEIPREAAIRELGEELGVKVLPHELEYLGCYYSSPGTSTEKIYYFYVSVDRSLVPEKAGNAEEGEHLSISWKTARELRGMDDAKALVALYLLSIQFS